MSFLYCDCGQGLEEQTLEECLHSELRKPCPGCGAEREPDKTARQILRDMLELIRDLESQVKEGNSNE